MPYTIPAAPVALRTPSLPHRELQDRLDELARTHRVPGAQLALNTGADVLAVHTGATDVTTGRLFTEDTAVPLGSLTKPFTAALVMLLADDGDLDLDEPAAGQLAELAGTPEVTVRQLLGHTSGLPTGPDSDTAAATTSARYLAAVCTARDLLFRPGTDFSYSNAGYVAAGRLVEAVTGMPWPEAVRTLLLEPLGVRPAFLGDTAPGRPVAVGHAVNTATGLPVATRQNLAPLEAPAGALLASALDLVAFGNALTGRSDLLPPAVAKEMRRAEPAAHPGTLADGWGAGLALYQRDGRVWCGHDGNAQGTSCHLRADPESGVVVAFTGNAGGATALWRDLADELARLTGIRVPAETPTADRGGPVDLPGCAGTYRNGSMVYRVAPGPDGMPGLSVDGDLALPLVCYADLSCDLRDPVTGLVEPGGRFHRDPATGVIDRVQISGRTARRTDDG
ncbi:serine hydrolase domain-containing protein [Streptomyces sp. NRRL S-1521]|uniref:serine hydrolase domain-containing protein n=1 Tax=Streptomyces sp. NRRL S-1521 TaxID=1609100 RepID=UPI0007479680|nr:serine hydrolase domain-containing protein [Streptomyces sp. NRRL S-1521]KUL63369.1 penicillin-binding protein [Streptomyces sp. NRRL S-1521]